MRIKGRKSSESKVIIIYAFLLNFNPCPESWKKVFGLSYWTFCRTLLFKGTVSRDGYFLEGLNISISTFCVCADGFQGLLKAFHFPIQLLTEYLLLRNYLLIRKMLYWNPSQSSLFCYWSMSSSADISLAAGKTHKNCLVTGGFRYDFMYRATEKFLYAFSVSISLL